LRRMGEIVCGFGGGGGLLGKDRGSECYGESEYEKGARGFHDLYKGKW